MNPAKVVPLLGLLVLSGIGFVYVTLRRVPRGPAAPSPPSPQSLAPLRHSSRAAAGDRRVTAAAARLTPRHPRAPILDQPAARGQSTHHPLHHPLPSAAAAVVVAPHCEHALVLSRQQLHELGPRVGGKTHAAGWHWRDDGRNGPGRLPLCVATACGRAQLRGRIPVQGEWVPAPNRRPPYLLPTAPTVNWTIPCRSAAHGGHVSRPAANVPPPRWPIENGALGALAGVAGGNASLPWREWGDPPPPRVPPRTQWEWRPTGCELIEATRARVCRLLVARRSHVLLLGDSRMRIMAFALYKMLGGEGMWSREQLDCCKALVEVPTQAQRRCCERWRVCAEENGGEPLLITYLDMATFIPDSNSNYTPPYRRTASGLVGGRSPGGSSGGGGGGGSANRSSSGTAAAAAAESAAEAKLWPQAQLWLQRGYRIIVADDGSRWPKEKKVRSSSAKLGGVTSHVGAATAAMRAATLAAWRERMARLMRRVRLLVAAGAVFVWHATPPGSHAGGGRNGCWGAGVLSRAQLARTPRPAPYNWGLIADYVEAERRALASVGRGAYLLDTHLADQLRPDALVGSVMGYPGGNTGDCFHPCLPGLPDLWNEQLWNLLLTLDVAE